MKELVVFIVVIILASLMFIPKVRQQRITNRVWLNDDLGNKYHGYEENNILYVTDKSGQSYTFKFGSNGKIYRINDGNGDQRRFDATITDSYKRMKGYGV
ncbi:MAG: hypothetical protein GY858_08875 [Candidatus Omnitrophica bacterium]|nr:hypothetical protein [Candidatus Omnitrophota bacterium]